MNRRMRMAEGFIAVDWGTTNRRAYRIDGDGRCGDEFEDDRGVLSVPEGHFGGAVAEIRPVKAGAQAVTRTSSDCGNASE